HRSSNGPANGPTTVNGSNNTAKAAATAPAVAIDSGEKKNSVARPAWNMPSPHWETSRTANNLRKSRCTATVRKSVHILTLGRLSRAGRAVPAPGPVRRGGSSRRGRGAHRRPRRSDIHHSSSYYELLKIRLGS